MEANQTVPVFLQDIEPDLPEHEMNEKVKRTLRDPIFMIILGLYLLRRSGSSYYGMPKDRVRPKTENECKKGLHRPRSARLLTFTFCLFQTA